MVHGRATAGRRLLGFATLFGLVLSQPGHALAYFWEYGRASVAIQSQGAHSYFPVAFQLSAGAVAAAIVVVAAAIGVGRLVIGRALGLRRGPMPSPVDLLIALAAVQTSVFLFQETIEAEASGTVVNTAWVIKCVWLAAAGQLPVAVVASVLIAWCSVRLEALVEVVRSVALCRWSPVPVCAEAMAPRPPVRTGWLGATFPAAFVKRGPPPLSPVLL